MRLNIKNIIFFIIIYLPFENMALKYLPVNDTIYSLLRFVPEIIIYLLFFYVFGSKLISGKHFNKNPINTPVIIFILYSFLLILINSAPFTESMMGLRTIFRYVVLFYVIINLDFEYRTIKKLIACLLVIALIQSIIAIYHHYFGISNLWMPRANSLEIGGKITRFRILNSHNFRSGREIGVGLGTFGDSVLLAMFLVIGTALIIPFALKQFKKKTKYGKYSLIGMVLIFAGLLTTYSRGSFLVALMMIPIGWALVNNVKKITLVILLTFILGAPTIVLFDSYSFSLNQGFVNPIRQYVSPIENVTSVFDKDYQNKTLQYSRGYIITVIGGKIIKSMPFFGNSSAAQFALEKTLEEDLTYVSFKNLQVINDVYWIAFIIYFGFIGLAIFLYILYKLFKIGIFVLYNTELLYYKILSLSFVLILITSIPYSFIIRTFAFRQFSFYFWTLAAFTVLEWHRLNKQKTKAKISLVPSEKIDMQ